MKSLSGTLNINISNDKEILLTNIKDNSNFNENTLKKLMVSYKALNNELDVDSNRLNEISESYT